MGEPEDCFEFCRNRLQQAARADLLATWQVGGQPCLREEGGVFPTGPLQQIWQVPAHWAGAKLTLRGRWWAARAEVWVDGTRRQVGDLFDDRAVVGLTEAAVPGTVLALEIRLWEPPRDRPALVASWIEARFAEPGDWGTVATELGVVRALLPALQAERPDLAAAIAPAIAALRERLAVGGVGRTELAAWREQLLVLAPWLQTRAMGLLGHAHIDVAWLWPIAETHDVCRRTFASVIDLRSSFPDVLTFNQSTALFYRWLQADDPSLWAQIQGGIAAGWGERAGGMWVEPDGNLPLGESTIRQMLYGQKAFQRWTGQRARVAWLPDTFGFHGQWPQLLKKAGFTAFFTQKLSWNDTTVFPHRRFWWEGMDGSRIRTYFTNALGADIDPVAMAERMATEPHSLWLYGVGDHGGGPTADMLTTARHWQRSPLFPRVYPTTAAAFAETLPEDLPVWRGELYLEFHRGTYTTKADVKRRYRRQAIALLGTETYRAIAAVGGHPYPHTDLQAAWERLLIQEFHDILPGTSIPEVFAETTAIAQELDTQLLSLQGQGGWFNALAWARRAWLTVDTPPAAPHQPVGDQYLIALQAPAWGLAQPDTAPVPPLHATPFTLSNAWLTVDIDPQTGDVAQVARGGRATLRTPCELQAFDDRGQYWDAWNIDPNYANHPLPPPVLTAIALTETGPLRAAVASTLRLGASTIRRTVRLYAHHAFVEIGYDMDWQESGVLLKLAFPLAFATAFVTYEIPFGAIARPTRPQTPAERAQWEVPAQFWADASTADQGLAIATDSQYGWDAQPDTLRLSLLRSPQWPCPESDRGRHRFTLRLYPHDGDWRTADIVRQAWELNTPLLPCDPRLLGGYSAPGITISAPNVLVSAFKPAEDQEGRWILRLYESHGQPTYAHVTLAWPLLRVQRCNLLEEAMDGVPAQANGFSVTLTPFAVETFGLTFGLENP
ncbi:MAG: glycoside hydrolase family 38 C-terminal domain-containing protein [Pseudanabaenaceae cyanobacterium]